MASIWAKGCIALMLAALLPAAVAAKPAKRLAPAGTALVAERFELPAGTLQAPSNRRKESTHRAHPERLTQADPAELDTIEGPSWRYQTSRRGPTFEMGALGGGTTEDAPFLAHVAMAWKF